MNASNVGFRMLRNAGWNVGEGLGKTKQGATEPLRVARKTSRRGVGGEDPAEGPGSGPSDKALSVVGARRAKRPRPSEARDGASDARTSAAAAKTGKNVGDEKRRRAAAADAFARAAASAFDAPSADADVNPLLRRRARDHNRDLSANNPLRGLF